jgi:hypothetical protein
MFGENEDMYQPVLEYLEDSQNVLPVGNHTSFYKAWFEQSLTNLQDIFSNKTEKEKAERIIQLVSDAMEIFLETAENSDWKRMNSSERKMKVNELEKRPQIEQRSEHWYIDAANYLTASEFSKLFGSQRDIWELLQKKANPVVHPSSAKACRTSDMRAFDWGIRFEPVIKQILEKRDTLRIKELGRLKHLVLSRLAASPDGIIEEAENFEKIGRLVEIKCPYTRSIGKGIPFDYWIQMQIQMEVTDVDECEYVEAIIESLRPDKKDWSFPTTDLPEMRGKIILCSWGEDKQLCYVYGGIGEEDVCIPEGWKIEEEIPWILSKIYEKIVHRDRTWFRGTAQIQELFWEDVAKIQRGDMPSITPPEERKKMAPKCLIQDSSEETTEHPLKT